MDKLIVEKVRGYLAREEYNALLALCDEDARGRRALWLALDEADDSLRYRAVEAVAKLMELWWHQGRTEKVREHVRRLLWAMNDEAGQMSWSAPEAIAGIVALVPDLLDPYAGIMISRAFEEPPLVASGLRGIARLDGCARQAVGFHEELVLGVFRSGDPRLLGLAAWAMGEVGFVPALSHLRALEIREEVVTIDTAMPLPGKSLGRWAAEAIEKIESGTA